MSDIQIPDLYNLRFSFVVCNPHANICRRFRRVNIDLHIMQINYGFHRMYKKHARKFDSTSLVSFSNSLILHTYTSTALHHHFSFNKGLKINS